MTQTTISKKNRFLFSLWQADGRHFDAGIGQHAVAFLLLVLISFFQSGCASFQIMPKGAAGFGGLSASSWKVPWDTREGRMEKSKEFQNKASDLQRKGRYVQAIQWLEKAKEVTPLQPEIYLATGQLHGRVRNFRQSIIELEKGLELDPQSVPITLELASAYLQNKNFFKTIESAEKVLQRDTENVEALRLKLHALHAIKRNSQAIGVGYEILAILPNDYSAKETLCKIYLQENKPRRSWILLQQLVSHFEPEKLPANLRYLEFQTLLAMQRDSDAALCLKRWYENGGASDPLWNQCYSGSPNFLKRSADRYLTKPSQPFGGQELKSIAGNKKLLDQETKQQNNQALIFDPSQPPTPDQKTANRPAFRPIFQNQSSINR